ncbi:ABC transporter permease [Phytohabitans houttuyneae]|uniref:Transport permease protein n=1 Tax=Phytohabitans houttuyneae TaxID=1076126 RepID=A0A6V8KTP5_9ACTN|nr:ABC transporter permease [Phytohabitans houttuyneae]GFJ85187.1 transport permease protein [Phytohabitans houttuyneae]
MTTAVTRLTIVESKLFVRDTMSVVMGIAFPAVLLLLLGFAIPGFREATDDLNGLRPIDIYVPIVLAMAICTTSVSVLPTYLATYRERGVLRRLATTPVGPVKLLSAQLVVNGVGTLIAIALAVAVGTAAFGVDLPQQVPGFLIALVLGTAAMFAVGLLIAAVAPRAKTATGIGMLVYFPMLFFAGVWTPGPVMPDGLRRVSDFTPLGAASQAMQDSWTGTFPSALHLVVMAAYVAVAGALAARLFRWE